MAKKGGGDDGLGLVLLALAGLGLAWLIGGRGKTNSPVIPDKLEEQIDLVVESLNEQFGHQWVDLGLSALQAYLERTLPQVAWLVNAVYAAEQAYRNIPKAGYAKKQVALQRARELRA